MSQTAILQRSSVHQSPASCDKPSRKLLALSCLGAVFISLLTLTVVFNLSNIDLTIPLGTHSDNSFAQAVVKNFIVDGHYYTNSRLGAPGEQELYDFPSSHSTHLLILLLLRLVTRNFGLAINLFYFSGFVLSTVTSFYVLIRLGASLSLAVCASVLYAFSPFHLLRGEAHLFYGPAWSVPLVILICIWVAEGKELFWLPETAGITRVSSRLLNWDGLLAVAVCIVVAGDNPYAAFFAVGFLFVSGLLGIRRGEAWRTIIAIVVLGSCISLCFVANLLPSILYMHRHGRLALAERAPEESEMYGLTIIQMVSPTVDHREPHLAKWKVYYNTHAPLVNENDAVALGAVGAVGFLTLIAYLFVGDRRNRIYNVALMAMFGTLVGTIGGFGAVVSFTVSPQLRAYNRVSIYIAFLSILGLVFVVDRLVSHIGSNRLQHVALVTISGFVLIVGLPDEILKHPMQKRSEVEREFLDNSRFVASVEASLPASSMIYQLPYIPFPEAPPPFRMTDYDLFTGYLHSKTLRWSYGAMKWRDTDRWIASTAALPVEQLVAKLREAGFAGIYIDRYGYGDRGQSIEAQLVSILGSRPLVSANDRLSFFALSGTAGVNSAAVKGDRVRLETGGGQTARMEVNADDVILGNVDSAVASTPYSGATGGILKANGWAISAVPGVPLIGLTVYLDDHPIAAVKDWKRRPDVAAAFGREDFAMSGWEISASTEDLHFGKHRVRFQVENAKHEVRDLAGQELILK